jgi:hypothetical protein
MLTLMSCAIDYNFVAILFFIYYSLTKIRLDQEEGLLDIQKAMDELKRTADRHVTRQRQVCSTVLQRFFTLLSYNISSLMQLMYCEVTFNVYSVKKCVTLVSSAERTDNIVTKERFSRLSTAFKLVCLTKVALFRFNDTRCTVIANVLQSTHINIIVFCVTPSWYCY